MAIFWGSPAALIHRGTADVLDAVDYTDSPAGIFVDLTVDPRNQIPRPPGRPTVFGGYAEGDQLVSIESIWGSRFNDTIAGGDENTVRINGLPFSDFLFGYDGDDLIYGGGGNDFVRGESGNDVLYGEDGNDVVFGDRDRDIVDGGSGDDVVWGGKGDDIVIGGPGVDNLEGGAGADALYGDTVRVSNGQIIGPGPNVTVFTLEHSPPRSDFAAYLWSNEGVVVDLTGRTSASTRTEVDDGAGGRTPRIELAANAGGHAAGDVLYGIGGIIGSPHDDFLAGDSAGNVIFGNAGNDFVAGDPGHDALWGGKGSDTLIGGTGRDYLEGGAGADVIYGDTVRVENGQIVGPGPDEPVPPNATKGAADDIATYLRAPRGVVIDLSGNLQGGAYSTVTHVSDGNGGTTTRVELTARAGEHAAGDVLYGIWSVFGSEHADVLVADRNGSGLVGAAGNDRLIGGPGNDVLSDGEGMDTLTGGPGRDRFEIGRRAQATDRVHITDFERGDVIDIREYVITAPALASVLRSQQRTAAGSVIIELAAFNTLEVTLTGGATSLTASDFWI